MGRFEQEVKQGLRCEHERRWEDNCSSCGRWGSQAVAEEMRQKSEKQPREKMSTDYVAFERDGVELSLWEGSSQFRICMHEKLEKPMINTTFDNHTIETRGERLTSEEVVDIAIKLIHPTLYNVEDPKKFQEEIIKKIQALAF